MISSNTAMHIILAKIKRRVIRTTAMSAYKYDQGCLNENLTYDFNQGYSLAYERLEYITGEMPVQ